MIEYFHVDLIKEACIPGTVVFEFRLRIDGKDILYHEHIGLKELQAISLLDFFIDRFKSKIKQYISHSEIKHVEKLEKKQKDLMKMPVNCKDCICKSKCNAKYNSLICKGLIFEYILNIKKEKKK